MRITFQYSQCRSNKRTEGMVSRKFQRFEKMFDNILLCQVMLKKEKNDKQKDFIIEAKLSVPGNDLYASEQAESFEIATEKVCVDLEKQVRKHKEKLNKKQTKPVDAFITEGEEEEMEEDLE